MAHFVEYRLQTQRRHTLADFMDFLQRARWKEYHRVTKTPAVGRYLDVLQFFPFHLPDSFFTAFLPIQYATEYPMDSKHHHHPPTLSDLIRLRRRNVEYDTTDQ